MITILGSSGYIGSSLLNNFNKKSIPTFAPDRDKNLFNHDLGDVIYCIGMTADFRLKPFETVESHVSILNDLLKNGKFDSLTYLSSSRVYIGSSENVVDENSNIVISINDPDSLYNLTKLTGERICLSSGRNTKIIRLSNIYGDNYDSPNFIFELIKKIKENKFIELYTSLNSSKDYLSIDLAVKLITQIALGKTNGIFNLASGNNISNKEIIDMLNAHFDFKYNFNQKSKEVIYPQININKIKKEFNFKSEETKDNLLKLIKKSKNDTNR